MKSLQKILLAMLVLVLAVVLVGCGSKGGEQFGEKIENAGVTEIENILKNPEEYDGKTVIIEGKIIQECMTGCWFDVKQNNNVIHVDIKPSGFAIPQKVGEDVRVEGKVSFRDGQLNFVGKGVEIK